MSNNKTCLSTIHTIANNSYNLARSEFLEIREHENNYETQQLYLEKFSKSELHTFEGIIWFNIFIDLIYVMVITRINEILTDCSHQSDRSSHWSSAVNLYVIAISFFIIMFFTRHQMDEYSSLFMQLAAAPGKVDVSYPLLQTDLFHRLMIAFYGLGIFIMTMNIALKHVSSEDAGGTVGSCRFIPVYVSGFAIGYTLTRGLMIILFAAILIFAKDKQLTNNYRFALLFPIVRNILTIFIVSIGFSVTHDNNNNNNANINLILLPVIAVIEFINEFIPILMNTCLSMNVIHTADKKQPVVSSSDKQQPKHVLLFYDAEAIQERLSTFFLLVLGETFISLLKQSYDPQNESAVLVQFLVYLLLVSTGLQFFETVDIKDMSSPGHAMLAPAPCPQLFVTVHIFACFTLLLATNGMAGLFAEVLVVFPSKGGGSSHHNVGGSSDSPSSYPSSRPSSQPTSFSSNDHGGGGGGAGGSNGTSTDDYFSSPSNYYYYYMDDYFSNAAAPSPSLSQWQIAIGLCLSEIACMIMRLMHVHYRNIPPNCGNSYWQSFFSRPKSLVMEIVYSLAAFLHLLTYFALSLIAYDDGLASFVTFTVHSVINILVSVVYLIGKLTIEEEEEDIRKSALSFVMLPTVRNDNHNVTSNPLTTVAVAAKTASVVGRKSEVEMNHHHYHRDDEEK